MRKLFQALALLAAFVLLIALPQVAADVYAARSRFADG